jgi:glycerol dehydrogenase
MGIFNFIIGVDKMKKIFISPSKYVQGENELANLGLYVKDFGKKALLVASSDDQKRVQSNIDEELKRNPFEIIYGQFTEECTKKEIDRMKEIAKSQNCDVIIGLGGGKALDTAKAASFLSKKPVHDCSDDSFN